MVINETVGVNDWGSSGYGEVTVCLFFNTYSLSLNKKYSLKE